MLESLFNIFLAECVLHILVCRIDHLVIVEIRGSCILERLVRILWVVHRDVAAAPIHLDTLLQVSLGDSEILVRDSHLGERVFRLARTHSHLLQEVIEWRYQVLAEIEVIVIHSRGQNETAGAGAVVVQFLRVLVGYQVVLHSMDHKRRRCHLLDLINVLEPILNQVLQQAARLVLRNGADRLEGRHQEEAAGLSQGGYVAGGATSHAATEYDDV